MGTGSGARSGVEGPVAPRRPPADNSATRPVEKLPASIRRFHDIGGAVDFAVFEEAQGSEEEILAAVPNALTGHRFYDPDRLRALGARSIGRRQFFGDWFDHETGDLLRLGDHRSARRGFKDPTLREIDGVELLSSAMPLPEPGGQAGFAYAFSHPPYRLRARPGEVQELFEKVVRFILPDRSTPAIMDWTSPRLTEVSDYFEAGMEWWGVALFSIHVPEIGRLTIVAASTTD